MKGALGAALVAVLFVASIVIAAWVRFAAPCDSWVMSAMPVKDVPARCITWVKP